jgi:periplasmic protein TonB
MPMVTLLLALFVPATPQPQENCAQAQSSVTAPPASTATSDCPRRPRQKAQPKGSPTRWLTLEDYPTRAIREERGGTVQYRLKIGSDGRPMKCDVTSTSGDAILDQQTCSILLRRARFCPATDRKGRPIEGEWTGGVTWKIPD